jgi:hypothetical protein
MERAWEQSQKHGLIVVVLTFARTDTRWWHEFVSRASMVWLLKGRVHFVQQDGTSGPAPAPSAAIVFTPWDLGPPKVSMKDWRREGLR